MRAFTVATHHEGYLSSLEESARKYGYTLQVLGFGRPWQGFVHRWQLLLDALVGLPTEDVVLVVDGFDTVITAPAACLELEYRARCEAADRLMFGVEHRREHCSVPFWMLSEVFRRYHGVGHNLPIVNAGVCVGPVRLVRQLCREMQAAAKTSTQLRPDDQTILNRLVAQNAADPKKGIKVDCLEGLHAHCERKVTGPLRHLYSNVPLVPNGPLRLHGGRVGVRIDGRHTRVFVVHGIFCTSLTPVCEALSIAVPEAKDLRRRRISQLDLRMFVETSRWLVGLAVIASIVALVKAGLETGRTRPLP